VLLLAQDGVIARRALMGFAPREIADFSAYLRRLIANMAPGMPEVWSYQSSQASKA